LRSIRCESNFGFQSREIGVDRAAFGGSRRAERAAGGKAEEEEEEE